MTLAGWVPWLMDTLHTRQWEPQETFDTYVRQNSVLLAPGEAGRSHVSGRKRWGGPWRATRPLRRLCPACAADADPRRALVWQLPLTAGCLDHGCRLEDAREIAQAAVRDQKPQPVPVEEPLATLDRCTYEGSSPDGSRCPDVPCTSACGSGCCGLCWTRSVSPSPRGASAKTTLECIWQATGRPERGGLNVWQPYEQMDGPMQEAMLHAAATGLQLAADGRITACGTLGSALQLPGHQHVYDGDRPAPYQSAWREAMAEVGAAITLARADRDTAGQLLALLTIGCRTLDRFEEERAYLFGIPRRILPSARELGRVDLT